MNLNKQGIRSISMKRCRYKVYMNRYIVFNSQPNMKFISSHFFLFNINLIDIKLYVACNIARYLWEHIKRKEKIRIKKFH